jgi:hypothetical protein
VPIGVECIAIDTLIIAEDISCINVIVFIKPLYTKRHIMLISNYQS